MYIYVCKTFLEDLNLTPHTLQILIFVEWLLCQWCAVVKHLKRKIWILIEVSGKKDF